jgi:hypothetical protein
MRFRIARMKRITTAIPMIIAAMAPWFLWLLLALHLVVRLVFGRSGTRMFNMAGVTLHHDFSIACHGEVAGLRQKANAAHDRTDAQ